MRHTALLRIPLADREGRFSKCVSESLVSIRKSLSNSCFSIEHSSIRSRIHVVQQSICVTISISLWLFNMRDGDMHREVAKHSDMCTS